MSGLEQLSLDRLQALLRVDAERRRVEEVRTAQRRAHLAATVDAVGRHMGVFPGSTSPQEEPRWMRPLVQANLYRCPLSARRTTLVEWKTLPILAQAKLRASGKALGDGGVNGEEHDESPGIVEVPLEYLQGSEEGGNASYGSSISRRPVKGNLSDKLAEYTRGMAGQRSQPFRPGGLGQDSEDATEEKVDPYHTEESIQRSIQVLDQGSEVSWNNGHLITAPPGLGFKVGLSWDDVYGVSQACSDVQTVGPANVAIDKEDVPDVTVDYVPPQQLTRISTTSTTPGVFSRTYFDDDSLFGSSSSESDSDEDENNVQEGESDDVLDADPNYKGHGEHGIFVGDFNPENMDEKADQDVLVTDREGIDRLLAELTISDDNLFTKRKPLKAHPLELAAKHKQDQNNENRKSWASTRPLPIEDFNAMFPNPALKFPFTLDEFQQQAVARLERSESVFVAAHTSAG